MKNQLNRLIPYWFIFFLVSCLEVNKVESPEVEQKNPSDSTSGKIETPMDTAAPSGDTSIPIFSFSNFRNSTATNHFINSSNNSNDYIEDMIIDSSGSLFVLGRTRGEFAGTSNLGGQDLFVRKVNSDGSTAWTKNYGTSQGDTARTLAIDHQDNVYIGGFTGGTLDGFSNQGGEDYIFFKIDNNGEILLSIQGGSSGQENLTSLGIDSQLNIYALVNSTGELNNNASLGLRDCHLLKFNPDGALVNSRRFGSMSTEECRSISITNDDKIIITLESDAQQFEGFVGKGDKDAYTFMLNSDLSTLWSAQIGGDNKDEIHNLTSQGNNVIICGPSASASINDLPNNPLGSGNNNAFITNYNLQGEVLWTYILIAPGPQTCGDIEIIASANQVAFTGYTSSDIPALNHYQLGQLDSYTGLLSLDRGQLSDIKFFQGSAGTITAGRRISVDHSNKTIYYGGWTNDHSGNFGDNEVRTDADTYFTKYVFR